MWQKTQTWAASEQRINVWRRVAVGLPAPLADSPGSSTGRLTRKFNLKFHWQTASFKVRICNSKKLSYKILRKTEECSIASYYVRYRNMRDNTETCNNLNPLYAKRMNQMDEPVQRNNGSAAWRLKTDATSLVTSHGLKVPHFKLSPVLCNVTAPLVVVPSSDQGFMSNFVQFLHSIGLRTPLRKVMGSRVSEDRFHWRPTWDHDFMFQPNFHKTTQSMLVTGTFLGAKCLNKKIGLTPAQMRKMFCRLHRVRMPESEFLPDQLFNQTSYDSSYSSVAKCLNNNRADSFKHAKDGHNELRHLQDIHWHRILDQ
ncbi:hypothetical protein GGX14DRAFT_402450 [Mycena pura]|uniref:Uncharacterized protein n=1 Tax=Mycena pura TaxID=153505 RepID=A0AAD6UZ40_9AGAR|nr:hypothetical protein GGX14DRAFT_402450 [Mycena pura]